MHVSIGIAIKVFEGFGLQKFARKWIQKVRPSTRLKALQSEARSMSELDSFTPDSSANDLDLDPSTPKP